MSLCQLEIFCGTGGVGKTTLSFARAIYCSEVLEEKVAIITIDPAKRLKDLVGLNDSQDGELLEKVPQGFRKPLWIMLMNPQATFNRLKKTELRSSNRILELLMKPQSGMNEIMSTIELKSLIDSKKFDRIILDTPPGAHFIDFLQSLHKINTFFDSSWIEIFQSLSKKINIETKSTSFLKSLTSSGIKKLLSYFEKVTGPDFIEDFVQTVSEFFNLKDSFLTALTVENTLKDQKKTRWFLITAADQTKVEQAQILSEKSQQHSNGQIEIIINKSLGPHLTDETKIGSFFLANEAKLLENLKSKYSRITFFPEVICDHFSEQVQELTEQWKEYEN